MIFMVSILVFENPVFLYNRIREPRINFHAPYEVQGMGIEFFGVPNNWYHNPRVGSSFGNPGLLHSYALDLIYL